MRIILERGILFLAEHMFAVLYEFGKPNSELATYTDVFYKGNQNMKCALSIQEKLKDLRIAKKLTLEQLAEQTGLSKSALGSYENDEYKEISHKAIITLAKFYEVSADYLLGLSENERESFSGLSELRLDDDTVEILKSGTINNRLLCEIIKHNDFWKLMSDMEIYIDSIATMQIQNLNAYIAAMRAEVQKKHGATDTDHFVQTLKASEIKEDDFFTRLLEQDISHIAKELKTAHIKDMETADSNYNPLSDAMDIIKEFNQAKSEQEKWLIAAGNMLEMNFSQMNPYDLSEYTRLICQYSRMYKKICSQGRGKRK